MNPADGLPGSTGCQPGLPRASRMLALPGFRIFSRTSPCNSRRNNRSNQGPIEIQLSIVALVKARAQRRYPQRSRPGGQRRASAKVDAILPVDILVAFQRKAPSSLQNPSEADASPVYLIEPRSGSVEKANQRSGGLKALLGAACYFKIFQGTALSQPPEWRPPLRGFSCRSYEVGLICWPKPY